MSVWIFVSLIAIPLILIGALVLLRHMGRRAARRLAPADERPLAGGVAVTEPHREASVLNWMRHEIRTPINAIVGMTGLLQDTDLTPTQRDYLDSIRASADALSATINDIQDVCRLESGHLALEAQPFGLRDAVELSLGQVAAKAGERGLHLASVIEEPAPSTLVGDLVRLRQILVSLLHNAVKRTHAGEVSVRVSVREVTSGRHEVHFAVRDTGFSIAEEQQRRLLGPLRELVASERPGDALELGLGLARGLTALMGGRIWLESRPDGSTFHFTMVADAAGGRDEHLPSERPHPATRSASAETAPLSPLRILLADDSPVSRQVALGVLQRLGYGADVVSDGRQALEALERQPYDVVLLDLQMPGMDGIAVTRRICEQRPPGDRPRIVAVSASEAPEDRARWLAAGVHERVSKTFPLEELRSVLARCGRPRSAGGEGAAEPDDVLGHLRALEDGKSPGLARKVIEVFLEDTSARVTALRDAVARQDVDAVERLAHSLKGSASMVGARSLALACAELIQTAHAGATNDAAAVVAEVEARFEAVRRRLDDHLTHPAAPPKPAPRVLG